MFGDRGTADSHLLFPQCKVTGDPVNCEDDNETAISR